MTANCPRVPAMAAVILAALGSSLPCAASLAQTDPYQDLRKYDFQDRRAVMAIRAQTQAAGPDRARQASIESGLIGVLQDPNATLAGKQEATRLLWVVGSAKSVPILAKMLPNPAMSDIARYGLERNPDPSAAAALRSALAVSKGDALVGIINSLGNRGDTASVSALKKIAAGPDPIVSDAAITALGKVGTAASVAALRSMPSKNLAVYNALLRSADKLETTGHRPDSLRLYESLAGPSYPSVIRAGALAGLAANSSPRTGALALTVAQTATDPNLQRVAAQMAGKVANPSDNQRTIAAYPRLPAPAQIALMTAWSDRHETRAASVATNALRSDNPDVRAAAIRTASRIGGAAVVPALAEIAGGGEQAQVARESLARMGGAGVEQSLVGLLSTGKPEVQVAVVNILAERPGTGSTAALMASASGSDSRVASAALKAIGRTGSIGQESRLVEILVGTRSDEVRDAAQGAIVAIAQRAGDRNRAAAPLLSAYDSAPTPGKASLIAALAEVGGDRALSVITKGAASPDAVIHGAALNGLANAWSDSSGLPALLNLSRSGASRSERIVALRGYLRLVGTDDRAPATDRLARIREAMTVAERPEEKRQALSVLRDIRTPAAIEMAAASLDDPQLVEDAANTIIYLAAPQRRGNRTLPAVKGSESNAALDKVIRTVTDEKVRDQAQKLRQG